MKKGFLIILLVTIAAFFIHGCQSTRTSADGPAKSNAYPVGHDMNSNTDKQDDGNPLQGYS